MKTLVTGATGTVGTHVMRALTERGAKPRGFVRDHATGVSTHGPDAELAVGEYGDRDSVRAALEGIDQVFLTCRNHPEQVDWETAVIDAAIDAGVRRVVKLSALGAQAGSAVAFFDAHARIEAHLDAAGIATVLLRPAFAMSNVLAGAASLQQADSFFAPAAGAKVAMIDPRDIADVAALVLSTRDHDGRSYELTGPEAVTFDDVAVNLSAVLGRRIRFVHVSDDDAVAQLVANGTPEWFATNVVTQFGLLRQGSQTQVRDTVRELTGREPRTLAEFIRDHTAAFARPIGD